MTSTSLDLALCSAEPIRVPGAIQPHGWLACVDAQSGALLAWSRNWDALFPGRGLAVTEHIQALCRAATPAPGSLATSQAPVPAGLHRAGDRSVYASVHATPAHLVFEFEPVETHSGDNTPMYALVRRFVPHMQAADSLKGLCQAAAEQMEALTGFGRCLVYRFDDNGHGEVLAQALNGDYESYLDHHFPASDIPRQARELYAVSHIRLIADADYEPVPIVARDMHFVEDFDMTHSHLRSVSPVHIEYMRNMRTRASMSVSIMVRGRLWGLISCHSRQAQYPSFEVRTACEHLGQLLSLQIEAKEETGRIAMEAELRHKTLALVASLAESDGTLSSLVDHPESFLALVRACGAAVFYDEQVWSVGHVPEEAALKRLSMWLPGSLDQEFHTAEIGAVWPEGAALLGDVSGVLAISISQIHRHYIVWFRRELVQTVKWAGDPHKNASLADGRMHPRRSFATWMEQVSGRSLPWLDAEVNATLELRQALVRVVLRRAEEMAQSAAELGRVNKELEAFSYTVSHDLRAPMRHITGYVDLVLETEAQHLGPRSTRYLSHVKDASTYAGVLVDSLLEFSRMGRTAVKRSRVRTQLMVDEMVAGFNEHASGRRIEWDVDPALPDLFADPVLIQVAVRNLLDNAVKYTAPREVAHIRIRGVSEAQGDGLEVVDDGVGFQMSYVNKLFGVFQRLHKSEVFEGTGIGLASVKRIIERHGGQITAEGEVDKGAKFRFTIPRQSADAQAA